MNNRELFIKIDDTKHDINNMKSRIAFDAGRIMVYIKYQGIGSKLHVFHQNIYWKKCVVLEKLYCTYNNLIIEKARRTLN